MGRLSTLFSHQALEHYSNVADIKRVIINTHAIPAEFLLNYFTRLAPEDALECLKEMMRVNLRVNMQIVVSVAVRYHEQLGTATVVKLFESFNNWEGMPT